MSCPRKFFGLLLFCWSLSSALAQASFAPGEKRRVAVADTIEMTQWVNDAYFVQAPADGPVALFSPDQQKFLILVKGGNIARNTVEYSLLLYRTREALQAPRPDVLLTMSSSSNRNAIDNPKWLEDSKTIVFLGESPGGLPQVYSFDIVSRRLKQLTSQPTPIVKYGISRDGHTIVYEAEDRKTPDLTGIQRNGVLITTQTPSDLMSLVSEVPQPVEAIGRALYVQKAGNAAVKMAFPLLLTEYAPLSLSPDGRYAVIAAHVTTIPPAWTQYKDPFLHMIIQAAIHSHDGWSNVMQYMVLDTQTHKIEPLLDAPFSLSSRGIAWIGGGSSVVVSGTYLPLVNTAPAVSEARQTNTYVVEVRLPDREIETVTETSLKVLGWNDASRELLLGSVKEGTLSAREAFRKTGSTWHQFPLAQAISQPVAPVEVSLDEDMNHPPRIYAEAAGGDQQTLLLDLNPQFAHLEFGKVAAITWKASDGHQVTGGLYLPPDYKPGTRYPLVIQTHGFNQHRFWIDGPWSSAFAAQPLAAKEMLVLQVGPSVDHEEDEKAADTPHEAPRQAAAYEGAIDELDRRGLIDRNRVGIIGFSRTVYYVEYTLTHSKYHFAAASVVDGFDGGYMNYSLWRTADYELVNGGNPAGATLNLWMKNCPGFNLDRVTTPLHIEYYSRDGFLGGWEWFSGLTLLDKPVEFLWIPDGYHMLVKPWDRVLSQQGTVDWFAFWLEGERDLASAKQKQYERWDEFRRAQNRVSEKAVP